MRVIVLTQLRKMLFSRPFFASLAVIAATFCVGAAVFVSVSPEGEVSWAICFTEASVGMYAFVPFALFSAGALPGGAALAAELNGGAYRFTIARAGSRRAYLCGSMLAAALAGAIAAMAAELLCALGCAILLPWPPSPPEYNPGGSFSGVYTLSRSLYCLVLIANAGVVAGCCSLIGIAAFALWPKRFVVLLAPFLVTYLTDALAARLGLYGLSIYNLAGSEGLVRQSEPLLYVAPVALSAASAAIFMKFAPKKVLL